MTDSTDVTTPSRRPWIVLVVVAAVIAVALVAVVVREATKPFTPVSQTKRGPVLVVPGYGGSFRSLEPLIAHLKAEGREVVEVPPKANGTRDFRQQARDLNRIARRIVGRGGEPSVDVIGYSAGGVTARLWVKDFGGDEIARRVLTIASPHHGTELAALAEKRSPERCPKACEQIVPGSGLLDGLNSGDETPRGPRFITIVSTSDTALTPPESGSLVGALDLTVQELCPDHRTEHTQMPGDSVVLALVTSALGTGPPARPTDVTC